MKSILLGLLAIVGVSGCGGEVFAGCGDTVKAEAVSPDGRYVATAFERNCGATADYSTNVSLREAKESFDPSSQTPILTVAGQPTIALEWSTESTLAVALPQAGIFKKLEAWRDVRVVYR
jgi:hypothetical protein